MPADVASAGMVATGATADVYRGTYSHSTDVALRLAVSPISDTLNNDIIIMYTAAFRQRVCSVCLYYVVFSERVQNNMSTIMNRVQALHCTERVGSRVTPGR